MSILEGLNCHAEENLNLTYYRHRYLNVYTKSTFVDINFTLILMIVLDYIERCLTLSNFHALILSPNKSSIHGNVVMFWLVFCIV